MSGQWRTRRAFAIASKERSACVPMRAPGLGRESGVTRDGGVCWICNLPGATSADHLVPIADGGHPTDLRNLAAAHLRCNLARAAHRTNAIRRRRSTLRHHPWFDDEPHPPRTTLSDQAGRR